MPHLALLFCLALALAPVWRVYLVQTPGPPRVVFTDEPSPALLIGPASARLIYAPGHATRDLRFDMRIEPLDTNRRLRLTLMLTNNAAPFALQFPSGQDYDLVLRDEAGREAMRWSTDRMFTMVFRTIPIAKGELRWTADWPLPPSLPPGRYTLEASLATQPGPIFIVGAPIAF